MHLEVKQTDIFKVYSWLGTLYTRQNIPKELTIGNHKVLVAVAYLLGETMCLFNFVVQLQMKNNNKRNHVIFGKNQEKTNSVGKMPARKNIQKGKTNEGRKAMEPCGD